MTYFDQHHFKLAQLNHLYFESLANNSFISQQVFRKDIFLAC